MRSPLVVASLGLHVVVVIAFFVAGLWKLDRLEAGRRTIDLTVAPSPPPPAASGSPAAAPSEPFKKKPRTVTHALVQPTHVDPEVKPAATATEPGVGTGGTGTGEGSGSGTDPTGTGSCTEEPCGPAQPVVAPEPPRVDVPQLVPPTVLKGLRISGETQVHPSATEKTAILRDGKTRLAATYRVCVGVHGDVTSVSAVKAAGYAGYDGALVAALQSWRYRPYEIGGRAVPVCGLVTFIYSMQ